MIENISDERFEDPLWHGLTGDYEIVQMTSFHGTSFGVDEIQSMSRTLYIN